MFETCVMMCYNNHSRNACGDGFMLDNILKASQEQNRIITIMYQSGEKITKRNIRVIEMDNNKIKAMCYLRHQPRTFRKDCILAADFVRAEQDYS